jgi:hypothetical protein
MGYRNGVLTTSQGESKSEGFMLRCDDLLQMKARHNTLLGGLFHSALIYFLPSIVK